MSKAKGPKLDPNSPGMKRAREATNRERRAIAKEGGTRPIEPKRKGSR